MEKENLNQKESETKPKTPEKIVFTEEEKEKINKVKERLPVYVSNKKFPENFVYKPLCKSSCKFCRGKGYIIGTFNDSFSIPNITIAKQIKHEDKIIKQENIRPCSKSKLELFDCLKYYNEVEARLAETLKEKIDRDSKE